MCGSEPTFFNLSQLLGGAITSIIGGFVGYFSARRISVLNASQQAACGLRASFAPQLAYLNSTEGSIMGREEIQEFLYSALVTTHAAELEKYRFFIKSKSKRITYDDACEKYKNFIHPECIITVGDREPSVFFIERIRMLLKITL